MKIGRTWVGRGLGLKFKGGLCFSMPTPGSPSPESQRTSHWQSDLCSTIPAKGPSLSVPLPAPALVRSPHSCFSAHSSVSENLSPTFLFPDNCIPAQPLLHLPQDWQEPNPVSILCSSACPGFDEHVLPPVPSHPPFGSPQSPVGVRWGGATGEHCGSLPPSLPP